MPPTIITAKNAHLFVENRLRRLKLSPNQPTAGCIGRRTKYGECAFAEPATNFIDPIPRSEWKTLIKRHHKNFLHDHTKHVLPPHDQGGTNYCWAHGSVRAVEAMRVYEGQAPLILSAESVAVPITGGRNRGGYPEEALRRLISHGACDQKLWPRNDLNIKHATRNWEDNAAQHRIIRWIDVENFTMQMTLALLRVPIAIGLGWWSHLVCQLDPVLLEDGSFGIGIDNSHGPDSGDNGYLILDEEHGTADLGAFAPLTIMFSRT
jgi:hypothetical protein